MYTFCKAGIQDAAMLVRVRADFLACFGPLTEKARAALDNYREYVLKGLHDGSFVLWIAEIGGATAATGSITFYRLPPTERRPNGKAAYIGNMFTYPPYRRQGLAAKLLELLLEEARAAGCGVVQLHTSSEGLPLYEKSGFAGAEDVMEVHL